MVHFQNWLFALFVPMAIVNGIGSTTWGASVTMTLDSPTTNIGEAINLQVTVEGDRNPPHPTIQNVEAFDVQSVGTSSQMQIINGKISSSMIFQYLLYPQKEGNYTIGPAQVEVDGKMISSNTIHVAVTSSGHSQRAPRGSPGMRGPRGLPPTGTSDPDDHEDSSPSEEESAQRPYFVQAVIDRMEAYVNEQITYRFQLYMRSNMSNLQFSAPKFEGFFQESLGEQREYEKILNGVRWRVLEIAIALFPTKPGILNIEPAQLTGQIMVRSRRGATPFDSFFEDPFFSSPFQRGRPIKVKTDPISVSVLALPPEPPGFTFSGLVGQFEMESSLSPTSLILGDSATLTVKITGRGNLQGVRLPESQVSGIKIYDDEPKFKPETRQDRLGGTKTFKRALVPTHDGALSIPELTIGYFDPLEKNYKILKTPSFTLNVSPNPQGEHLTHVTGASPSSAVKENIKLLAEDIMPLKRTFGSLNSSRPNALERGVLLGSALLLPLFYLMALWLQRRRERISQDLGYTRRTHAYKTLQREMKSIVKSPSFENLSLHFRVYLGDRFDFDGLALTSVDTERKLLDAGISKRLAAQAQKIIGDCEMGQYGGGTQSASKIQTLHSEILKLVSLLEKERRGTKSHVHSNTGVATLPLLLVHLIVLGVATFALAIDELPRSATFYKANDAYEHKDYQTSIQLYQSLLETSSNEGEIHYNLGNAHFRNNEVGRALYHYLMAQRLMPRDADLNYNISFLKSHRKNQIEAQTSITDHLFGYLDSLNPWESYLLFCLTSLLFWGGSLLLLFFPQFPIKPLWGTSLFLCLITIAILIRKEWPTSIGVVTKPTAKVYSGLGRDNIVLFELGEGDEFEPIESSPTKEWIRIRLADGKQGWISANEILHS